MLGNIKSLGTVLDNAEVLKEVHRRIEQQRVPVASRDDIGPQLVELDRYMGTAAFTGLHARANKANLWSGVVALPILFYGLLLAFHSIVRKLGVGVDSAALLQAVNLWLIDNLLLVGAWAILVAGVIFYFKWLNGKVEQAKLALVDAFFEKTEPAAPFGGV